MAKKATPADRLVALIKRHPWKIVMAVILFFGAIPAAAGGYNIMIGLVEPYWIASHEWSRELIKPIMVVQNTQAVGMDRFLLYSQQEALAKAKADPAARTSPIVQERIRDLEAQVQDTQDRIAKASRK